MKKIMYIISIVAVIAIISCRKSERFDYSTLKSKQFSSLGYAEQDFIVKELTSRLKTDPDFQSYLNIQSEIMLSFVTRDRSKKMVRTTTKNPNERIRNYADAGFENPNELLRNQAAGVISLAKVYKKYPELRNLDGKTRSKVLKGARGKLSKAYRKKMVDVIKNKTKEKAENL